MYCCQNQLSTTISSIFNHHYLQSSPSSSLITTIIIINIIIIKIVNSIIIIIIILIIIIWFLTLSWAFISALHSSRVRTISRWPYSLAYMRAVFPNYNNNEEIRYENKIKIKKIIKMIYIKNNNKWWWWLLW